MVFGILARNDKLCCILWSQEDWDIVRGLRFWLVSTILNNITVNGLLISPKHFGLLRFGFENTYCLVYGFHNKCNDKAWWGFDFNSHYYFYCLLSFSYDYYWVLGLEPNLCFQYELMSGFVFLHKSEPGEDFNTERGSFL